MFRRAFVAVLLCSVLTPVEQAYAECRTTLPPAAERAGYWQYRIVHGKRCWFGPLKAGARANAAIVKRARVVTRPKAVRTTTGMKPIIESPVRAMPAPEVTPQVTPPDDNDEIWPKPDANFAQRFDALRQGVTGTRPASAR